MSQECLQHFTSCNFSEILTNVTSTADLPWEVVLIKNLCIPILLVIFIFGLIGNALTVIVLRAKRLRQSSTEVYLTSLAVVDLLYLLTSLLVTIINYTFLFPSEMRHLSYLLCHLTPFLQYTLAYLSVWIIVAVTVDRAIWVALPFRARHICTKHNAVITVILFALVFVLLDSHFFWTVSYTHNMQDTRSECVAKYFTQNLFPYIDLLLICVLPFLLMLIANSLIGWQLKKVREFGRRRQVTAPQPFHITACESVGCRNVGSMAVTYEYSTFKGGRSQKKFSRHEMKDSLRVKTSLEKSSALTTMLVAISVFFMISVSPLLVYDVLYFALNINQWISHDAVKRGILMFGIERIVYVLWYSNFAVHFILYCLNGPQFRAKALEIFQSHCYHQRSLSSTTANGKSLPAVDESLRSPKLITNPVSVDRMAMTPMPSNMQKKIIIVHNTQSTNKNIHVVQEPTVQVALCGINSVGPSELETSEAICDPYATQSKL